MLGTSLSFLSPWVLLAFIILPVLWLVLRVTPPAPKHIIFPPLKIFSDIAPKSELSSKTPWFLLLLRLVILSLLILAAAGPNWTDHEKKTDQSPLLILVDNGASASKNWTRIFQSLRSHLSDAERNGRLVALIPFASPPESRSLEIATAIMEKARSLEPQSHMAARISHMESIRQILSENPGTKLLWISDGLSVNQEQEFMKEMAGIADETDLIIETPQIADALAIRHTESRNYGLDVYLARGHSQTALSGRIHALNNQGIIVAEAPFTFESRNPTQPQTIKVPFDIPLELRNTIDQFQIKDENTALSTFLLDNRSRMARIGIIAHANKDIIQPLLQPSYYVERALSPFAQVVQVTGSTTEQIEALFKRRVNVIILVDAFPLDSESQSRLSAFLQNGGILIRFAGTQINSKEDRLFPVRLREGGRLLGSVMSWEKAQNLAPFPEQSPFKNLHISDEITVLRQILAEPDGELMNRTWASLTDGTPLVTARTEGQGLLVLFHVAVDNRWSNLPLSGLFIDMLNNLIQFADIQPDQTENRELSSASEPVLSPRFILDGFGQKTSPPSWVTAIPGSFNGYATWKHPSGLYGNSQNSLAVNVLNSKITLAPFDFSQLRATILYKFRSVHYDLRAVCLLSAFILLIADLLLTLRLSGFTIPKLTKVSFPFRRMNSLVLALLAFYLLLSPNLSQAQTFDRPQQETLPPIASGSYEPALRLRLAYVLTGNSDLDNISKAGLRGISRILFQRTSVEPGEPVGIDLEKDELVFFPLIYWPILPSNTLPSAQALKKVEAFMQNGGTVLFDTRDALRSSINAQTEEAQYLQRLFKYLTLPPIEPVPEEHVLSKTYYLLKSFPGRYEQGKTWIEALPPAESMDLGRPARGGDSVSPVIISTNDLAAAWAIDEQGYFLFPTLDENENQKEYALRFGVNIVMYVLTGNYKTDQVHVPALLDRLKR